MWSERELPQRWCVTLMLALFVGVAGHSGAHQTPSEPEVKRFLVGDWCLNTETYDGEVTVDGSRWTFGEDGVYTYRQAYVSSEPFTVSGSEIHLENFGTMQVLRIGAEEMVTKTYSTYHFTRNDCLPLVGEAEQLTELNNAIISKDMEAVRGLVADGVDISRADTRSSLASTPLMVAIRHGGLDFVKYVLSLNPDLSVQNAAGRTALEVAQRHGDRDILALIEERSED